MLQELKNAIISWLIEHPNEWQRVNECRKHFSPYIFGPDHNFLEFGGEKVSQFIEDADKLLYE